MARLWHKAKSIGFVVRSTLTSNGLLAQLDYYERFPENVAKLKHKATSIEPTVNIELTT